MRVFETGTTELCGTSRAKGSDAYQMMRTLVISVAAFLMLMVLASGCDESGNEAYSLCGDGKVDPGEECDSGELVGRRCEDFGFRGGFLDCTRQCTYDFLMCIPMTCGDGVVDVDEECDGMNLGGLACQDFGYTGGELGCLESCRFDFSACEGGECGNGILEAGEECDGTDFGMHTCATEGFAKGVLGCTEDCSLDTSGCETGQPVCGNGVREPGEECDGLDLGDATGCEALGYYGGTLRCRSDCTYDLGECTAWGRCGDGDVQEGAGEQCDLLNLNGKSCEDYGYAGGRLECGPGCRFEFDGCEGVLDTCGNGVVDPGEECDEGPANSDAPDALCRSDCRLAKCGDGITDHLHGEECDDGTANSEAPDACRPDCRLPVCGDGIVDSGEECDDGTANSDLSGATCRTSCVLPVCGDGIVDSGEECDYGLANSDEPDALCRTDCTFARCGDGIADSGEECDEGPANSDAPDALCRPDCRLARCGDGIADPSFGEECDDGNATDWDGCNSCSVTEFGLNTVTAFDQASADVQMGTDGHLVAVWHSDMQDGGMYGIFARCYDTFGLSAQPEFQVNTHTSGDQREPRVAMGADGRFVVVWHSYNQDGSGQGVYGQRYLPDCTRDGSEFRVNTYSTSDQMFPDVAMAPDGRFVVVWQSNGQDGSYTGIFGQLFRPDCTRDGSEFQVNTVSGGRQERPRVAMGADGRFVVVWHSYGQDTVDYDVFARSYDASGVPDGTEFQVNSHVSDSQMLPDVAMAPDGRFVVVWQSYGQDGDSYGIFGQRYQPDGTRDGTEFQVNTHTQGSQYAPRVAVASDGRFVVAWTSNEQDGSSAGIFGQRYQPDGTRDGTEFQVNVYTNGGQQYPSVSMAPDGRFVVVWHSYDQDGAGLGVFGQRYTAGGTPIGSMPWP